MIGVQSFFIDSGTQSPRKMRHWGETEAEARANALAYITIARYKNTGFKLGPAINPKEDRT